MQIPTLGEATSLVSNIRAAVAAFTSSSASGLQKAESLLPIAASVASALFPAATLAGINVNQAFGVVAGLVQQEPTITSAFQKFAAAVDGGAQPTAAEWTAFNEAADQAHASLQAAAAAYRAAPG